MTISTSPSAYEDCYDIFDRALRSKNGIRCEVPDAGMGYNLRTRLQYARTLHREEMRRVHPPTSPEHGVSVYDPLVVREPRQVGDRWYVYVEHRKIDESKIEELPATGTE